MTKVLFWCFIISSLFVLVASGFGIAKIHDMVNVYAFSVICVIYFGMIGFTTGLLIYTILKAKKALNEFINELKRLQVEVENILGKLKAKLESIPVYVWKIIFKALGIKLPKR